MKLAWFYINILTATMLYGQGGSIEGRIYALDTDIKLSKAKLVLKKDNTYCQKIKTDHQGNYNFVNLEKGNYSIWVLKEGYCQLENAGHSIGR